MTKRIYNYAEVRYCRVGSMRCCSCGMEISEGQYRYHETSKAFVPCHRSCCPNDPKWKELDESKAEHEQRYKEYCFDVLAFYDKWGALEDDEFMSIVHNRRDHKQAAP